MESRRPESGSAQNTEPKTRSGLFFVCFRGSLVGEAHHGEIVKLGHLSDELVYMPADQGQEGMQLVIVPSPAGIIYSSGSSLSPSP